MRTLEDMGLGLPVTLPPKNNYSFTKREYTFPKNILYLPEKSDMCFIDCNLEVKYTAVYTARFRKQSNDSVRSCVQSVL